LLIHCEAAAQAAGFRNLELMSTLPGEPFYLAAGYQVLEPVEYLLPDGTSVRLVRMGRSLP